MTEQPTTQFRTEGQPAFPVATGEKETPAGSSTGEQPAEGAAPSSQGKEKGTEGEGAEGKGFADHPRWKERETEWSDRFNQQETRHTQEIQRLREDIEGKLGQSQKKPDAAPEKPPSWFGGDEDQWKEFVEWQSGLIGKAEQNVRDGLTKKEQDEKRAVEEATAYLDSQVASIEADRELNPGGEHVDRAKLLKLVLDNDLIDSKGRWNYKAGFLMMRASEGAPKAKATEDRKALAGATTTPPRAEPKPQTASTSADFRKPGARPW